MYKSIALALAIVGLTGCTYNESDLADAMAACDSRNGTLSVTTRAGGDVLLAHCTFGGFTYTYIRNTGAFTDAKVAE